MSVDTRAHFVNNVQNVVQVYIATIDIGPIPDEIDDLFKEVDDSFTIDFYINHNGGHMSNAYEDPYGNHLCVANLKDVYDTIINNNSDDWCEDGKLFKDMIKSLYSSSKRDILIFIENY